MKNKTWGLLQWKYLNANELGPTVMLIDYLKMN